MTGKAKTLQKGLWDFSEARIRPWWEEGGGIVCRKMTEGLMRRQGLRPRKLQLHLQRGL